MLVQEAPNHPKVQCQTCGRVADFSPAIVRLFRAVGPPACCGVPMDLPRDRHTESRKAVRRFLRPGVQAEVRRTSLESGPNVGAGVTNVSADGIGVRLTVPVVAGDELHINLCREDGSSLVAVVGKVRWFRPVGRSQFAVGLRFARRLTLRELAELVC